MVLGYVRNEGREENKVALASLSITLNMPKDINAFVIDSIIELLSSFIRISI